MLKRNKDIEKGLVNGSIGTVTSFIVRNTGNREDVQSISVKFDNLDKIVNIERESSSFEVLRTVYYTRKQFPLMLAFSITIHKSQGLSLQSAIVDAGAFTFGAGMTYVALSRVTALPGLHLIDLDRQKITCDKKAVEELNRLREVYTPHLGTLPTVQQLGKRSHHDAVGPTGRQIKEAGPKKQLKSKSQHRGIPRKIYANSSIPTNPATVSDIPEHLFNHCSIHSVDFETRRQICTALNLCITNGYSIQKQETDRAACRQLQTLIFEQKGRIADVTSHPVGSDGNCLFRSIALGITGSEEQHDILRSYVVNHMMNDNDRRLEDLSRMQENGQ